MSFKRNVNGVGGVSDILSKNREQNQNKVLKTTLIEDDAVKLSGSNTDAPLKLVKKPSAETTKPYNFTMKPSVREKLNKLVDYDGDFEATSAAGYISEFIEKRYRDLGLDKID